MEKDAVVETRRARRNRERSGGLRQRIGLLSRGERALLGGAVTAGVAGVVALGLVIGAAATGMVSTGGATEAQAQSQNEAASTDLDASEHGADAAADEAATSGASPLRVGGISQLADAAWAQRIATKTGIPERAMRAYAGATIRAKQQYPSCRLGWNTIAAIGQVESHHGTLDGGSIGPDGVAAPTIVGVALDGSGVAAIADTDGGTLDGDAAHDRAVGPMQFIPQTWKQHGVDGSGDGVADPQNIDDASLTAAAYLCADGYDLSSGSGWIAAIDGYNRGVEYNNLVADAANRYARAK
ncbi:lytic transglycosylase domain-containing protein [Pseudoclavibacter sp. CFCC 13611]|uniref:lytic transglycosylase domain-containing protein n=1 Tax=Pseudoclavibacter sp. CFCC 13611 TaxID=2615178 RepID=UPI001CE4B4BA|nr:lytic murein transglycosylase [Pseudoclavibacter sp. CFCC 13611]